MDCDHRDKKKVTEWRWRWQSFAPVQKCRNLWRTCGRRKMVRDYKGFRTADVEIFVPRETLSTARHGCSTWNIQAEFRTAKYTAPASLCGRGITSEEEKPSGNSGLSVARTIIFRVARGAAATI